MPPPKGSRQHASVQQVLSTPTASTWVRRSVRERKQPTPPSTKTKTTPAKRVRPAESHLDSDFACQTDSDTAMSESPDGKDAERALRKSEREKDPAKKKTRGPECANDGTYFNTSSGVRNYVTQYVEGSNGHLRRNFYSDVPVFDAETYTPTPATCALLPDIVMGDFDAAIAFQEEECDGEKADYFRELKDVFTGAKPATGSAKKRVVWDANLATDVPTVKN